MNDIFLEQIFGSISRLEPDSRLEMIQGIKQILGQRLVRAIDSHNTSSVIFIFTASTGVFLIKAEHGANSDTKNEILWYKKIPLGFPSPRFVNSFANKSFSALILEYLDAQPVDELIKTEKINEQELDRIIKFIIATDQKLFNSNNATSLNLQEADRLYFIKFQIRKREAINIPYLKLLFETPTHKINGKLFHPPDYYISRIQTNSTIHKYLTPYNYGLIHGDLHLGNILAHKDRKLFLVDPNGGSYMPLEYDIGKILQSLHGGYGEIMQGDYLLKYDQDEILLNIKRRPIYGLSFRSLTKSLSDQQYAQSLYTEAMHFITILPHHASDQNETTALFARGLELFNELFHNLNIN